MSASEPVASPRPTIHLINKTMDPLSAALSIGSKIIDRIFPDKAKAEEAKMQMQKMAQDGELDELKTHLSAIIAEAKSSDPWTSRARPSYMYVMYIIILFSIPMGILSVFNPTAATQIAIGMKSWLAAVPSVLWESFTAGYLGYGALRSVDKNTIQKLKQKAGL